VYPAQFITKTLAFKELNYWMMLGNISSKIVLSKEVDQRRLVVREFYIHYSLPTASNIEADSNWLH
jgi:hypothetical protein